MRPMSRRDFIKYLALIAAGAGALPRQIEAFERYYEANTPPIADGEELACADEIWICGLATRSLRVGFRLSYAQGSMRLGLNAFGGMLRWVAQPDAKVISKPQDFHWQFEFIDPIEPRDDMQFPISGWLSYFGSKDLVRREVDFTQISGGLDPLLAL